MTDQMAYRLRNGCLFIVTILLGCLGTLSAQHISRSDRRQLMRSEDTMRVLADSALNANNPSTRFLSDSQFVRVLVRTLRTKNSFYYPFDSIRTVSHLYSPDSAFRIFTWEMQKDSYTFLQEGAIQINTPDGSLKLFPLFDASMFTSKPQDSVRTRRNWIGAIYYKIVLKTFEGKKYYTMLGFDDFTLASTKKWMEVMTFNDHGEPVFGAPVILFHDDSTRKKPQYRFNIEYKKEAATRFNYDPEMDMIVYDHLVSEDDEPTRKDTYVPDGDFEGFKWTDGKWVHVDKVFNYKLKDGEFPTEEKLLDDAGNVNEQKLKEQTQKNLDKTKGKPPARPGGGQ
ncbi:MAG: hypothetical protein Q8937_19500 [Bacteroidota bacterium]|nr:hypothetical protein [Bacteroidota bacterium]